MLKQSVCSLLFCTALANAEVIYTFEGSTGSAFPGGPYVYNFQYTAPDLLAPGVTLFLPVGALDSYSANLNAVAFGDADPLYSDILTFDSVDAMPQGFGSFNGVFNFTKGTFTNFGTYTLDPSSPIVIELGVSGTLVVSQIPEPGTGALCVISLATVGLLTLRIRRRVLN